MEGINKIFCGTDVKNTGTCECFFSPELIEGVILVPRKMVFTETMLADASIAAAMSALTLAPKAQRVFPVMGFVQVTDNSEEDTIQTFGYGGQADAREGNYNWFFQFVNGGVNLSNSLRSFNGLIGKYAAIFVIPSQNTLIGTSKKDDEGNAGLAGIPLERLKTAKWKLADGTNAAIYGINFSFRPQYINELIAFKKVSTDSLVLSELAGLEDILLEIVEADSGDVTVRADTDCGSTDLFDLYADEFENPEAWIVKDADGETKTITSVTKDEDGKNWNIVLDGSFENGDTIQLAAASVLAADPVNVVGYESNVVTVSLGSL